MIYPAVVVLILVSLFLNGQLSDACGITTHTEIAHRAASNYDYLLDNQTSVAQMIQKYQPAFQAGNPYPDSFYPSICKKGVLSDVSEDTHWVPFLNATIKYIQKKYSKPYSEEALKLIVFTLGFTSHQMADVTWHSLGIDQGFLSAMGFANFHGVFQKAHSVGDIGGDIVNQFELNMNFISDVGDWYVPYQDLYNIYYQYYGKELITHADIIECSSLLFAGRLGEQVAIALLYADYYKKSSFLADKLYDYYLGGVDDMATWTQISWNKVLFMLETQVEKCKLDHSILYVNCTQQQSEYQNLLLDMDASRLRHRKTRDPTFYADKFNIDKSHVKVSFQGTGVSIKQSKKFQETFGDHLLPLKTALAQKSSEVTKTEKTADLRGTVVTSKTVYFSQSDYANLGWTMDAADLNADHFDDLIVGAPVYSNSLTYQDGAVFVVLANSTTGGLPLLSQNIETSADIVLHPPSGLTRSRFGHSVVALDLNQDGYSDLVVSAPSYGLQDLQYEGRLFIYLGDGSMRFKQPSAVVTCQNHRYCNLGSTLTKGDVNGDGLDDLIVGAPYAATCGDQCGLVAVLLSKRGTLPSLMDVSQFDWILQGSMAYQWFGHSVRAKLGYLAVGAPETRICSQPNCQFDDKDIQAVGSVYLFAYANKQPTLTLSGSSEFEQFGYSFDLSTQPNQKLVISVSSVSQESVRDRQVGALVLNRAGVVQTYDLTNLTQPKLLSVLKSDRPYAQFGSKVKYFKPSNADHEDLYISANMRTEDIALLNQIQEGMIFKFEGGQKFPSGNVTDDCGLTSLIPCPLQKADLVFASPVPKSRFGFEFVFLTSSVQPSSYQVAASSIHANTFGSRLSGTVSVFQF